MAKISSKRPTNRKGAPPKAEDASNIMTSVPTLKPAVPKEKVTRKDLNFKVPADFKKRFKNFATNQDMSMLELLIKSFEAYENNNK